MPRPKSNRKCILFWCDRKHYANDMCAAHDQNVRRHGTPIPPRNWELMAVLKVLGNLGQLAESLVKNPEYYFVADYDTDHVRFGYHCAFCEASNGDPLTIEHEEYCPIPLAKAQLEQLDMPRLEEITEVGSGVRDVHA